MTPSSSAHRQSLETAGVAGRVPSPRTELTPVPPATDAGFWQRLRRTLLLEQGAQENARDAMRAGQLRAAQRRQAAAAVAQAAAQDADSSRE